MKCDRCHRETDITIMSMLNTDILCLDCKEAEEGDPRYQEARRAEAEACRRGDLQLSGNRRERAMTRNAYEQNHARLEALIGQPLGDLRSDVVYRLRAQGFMDLVVEVLPQDPETGAMVLSLAHYFEQHGDLCQDPEMTVRVFAPRQGRDGMVEALTFQQAIPPIYQQVYPEPGNSQSPGART